MKPKFLEAGKSYKIRHPKGGFKSDKVHVDYVLDDPYYHGVGINLIDKEGKTSFKDVYCLTHWYTKEVEKLISYE